jgi:hypothetical protein
MRTRTLAVYLLILLCLQAGAWPPGAHAAPRPGRERRSPPAVYPITLHYRAHLYRELRLLGDGSPPCLPSARIAPITVDQSETRAAALASGAPLAQLMPLLE